MMKDAKLSALFFVSAAGIAFELYIMRVFSVGSWSNFGSLVITTALLGIGLAGIILTFLDNWVRNNTGNIMSVMAILLPICMSGALIAAQLVPFNPIFLASDSRQFWFIGAYYIIYGVPFFIIAVFVGVAFIALRDKIQKVYFWNMIGSGVGGVFIVVFMFLLPPQYLILPILCLSIAAAMLSSWFQKDGKDGKDSRYPLFHMIGLGLSAVGSIILILVWGNIRVSDFKDISYVRKYADSQLVHHSYGPGGEYHVYDSRYFHFAPGLSDNAALKIPANLSQLYWGLFIDGSGPIGIMGTLHEDEQVYMDYLPMAAPYTIVSQPDVLLVSLNGGINANMARYNEANSIDIVEPTSEMIRLLRDDLNVSWFTGNLLDDEKIRVFQGDSRSFCIDHKNSYDLIEISLVDSVGLTDSGGYTVHEDFKYTVEAFKEYFDGLKDGGILSVTVWDRLNPPRNVLRLLNTMILAMQEAGFQAPEQSLYSFGLLRSTTTILIKKGAFTPHDLNDLDTFVRNCSFDLFYEPGGDVPLRDIDILLANYRFLFENPEGVLTEDITNADMYRTAIPYFFAGEARKLEDGYIFDIRPIKDSRPYYSGFLKVDNMGLYLEHIQDISEEWGYLLLFAMLIQACIFGFIVIVLPVIVRHKTLFKKRRGTIGVIFYYAGLGLGYMLIEIFLIQRLAVFLSNPTYSASIVITVMLICSALGNIVSSFFKRYRIFIVPISCIIIAGCFLFYIFGLDGFLASFRSASLMMRILIAAIIIAPAAFFMGVPYPNGLDSLQETKPHLLPWAWGMNGGLSLVGGALARLLSVSSGFPVLLRVGIITYLVVGALFPINQIMTKE
jgi:SAM-dependent methyltransferase